MKLKYQEGKLVELSKLRPGECFCLLDSAGVMEPEVYLATDYQGEYRLYINIETGETMWFSDGLERSVVAVQVEATVKRYTDSKEGELI